MMMRSTPEVAEALRYFGAPAERLHRELSLLIEGIVGLSERLDRHRDEVKREFIEVRELIQRGYGQLDRRVRRLEGQRRRRRK